MTMPNFKTHYRATVVKTAQPWKKDKHTNQCNKKQTPEINLSNKDAKKNIGERTDFEINGGEKPECSYVKR